MSDNPIIVAKKNSQQRTCERCGTPLGRFAPAGVCARCMLEAGLSGPKSARADTEARTGRSGRDTDETEGSIDAVGETRSTLGLFGNYELLEEVGHGGMGVIYRARDLTLHRVVALKLMLAGQFASDREVKRFKTEAEAAARLDHPNIVPIYEFGELEGRPFLSMRFVDGTNLAEHLRSTPMDAEATAHLMRTLARATHYAHQHGILHRDLKPANVLVDSLGQPHVTDFGLAKCLDSTEGLTLSGSMLGSPNYMSPEQAAGHPEGLTTAADVYSLGAIMYELLTGRAPFRANTPLETMRKVVEEPPVAPHLVYRFADRDLETISLKCMEKQPASRYGSAEALAEDLDRWLRHEPIQARPVGTLGRLRKWTQRNPRTAALVLISCLAILAFLVGQTIMSVRLSRANTRVQAANAGLTRSLYEAQWRQADDAVRADDRGEAIAQFSQFLRKNPNDATAAPRLLSLLSSCNFPVLLAPPLVHDSPVVALGFNRAGDRLATATSGGTARLWNLESGAMEVELPHSAPLTRCFLCGENDRRLFTLSTEPKARLWDLDNRRLISEIELGPIAYPTTWRSAIPTQDHRRIAINVESNVVAFLDADSGVRIEPALTLNAEISRFAMSADGRLLALSSTSELRLFKPGSTQPLFAPLTLTTRPEDMQFSQDGHWLACLCQDRISLVNTVTGTKESEFAANAFRIAFLGKSDRLITIPVLPTAPLGLINPHSGKVCGSPFGQPEFGPEWNGSLLFSFREIPSYFPSTLRLLDPTTGDNLIEPFIHEGPFSVASLRRDGQVAATASQDKTVRIWSSEMRRAEPLTIPTGKQTWEAQWSPSGTRIFSVSLVGSNAEVRLWEARTGAALGPAGLVDDVVFFGAWAADGSRFATASTSGTVGIWSGETGQPMYAPFKAGSRIVHCAFSPTSELLATAGEDRTVRLWDSHTGKAVGAPLIHSLNPLKISFGSDGRRLATGSTDGTIRIWSVPEGKLLVGPLRHGGVCWVAAFSPDDRRLISASSDSTAQLWDAASGQPALPAFRHEGPVLWASFSPDGRAIATSTESGITRVWDTATGQLLSAPMRHPGKVWFVRWSPDGRFLATTCMDGAARLWDAGTGHMVAEQLRHDGEVRRAEFSPDGQRLLTASYDGTIKVWDLALLRAPLPVPDWLPMLAESLGGKRLGPKDSPESLPGNAFQLAKMQVERWGTNDYYGRWGQWMMRGRFERPVKAFEPR